MSVIPLTLTISLCLVFTFLVFFLREHSRSRLSSAERDAMLPFADEKTRAVAQAPLTISFKDRKARAHAHEDGRCSENKPDAERCPDCPSRRRAS